MIAALACAAALLTLVPAAPGAAPSTPAGFGGDECKGQNKDVTGRADIAKAERSLLCLVNVHRAASGIAPLTADARLTASAREHSEDMVARGFYDPLNPEQQTPSERAREKGYRSGRIGENIFALRRSGGVSPIQFVLGWSESEVNNAVLLDPAYVAAGTGFALGTPQTEPGGPEVPGATVTQDLGTAPAAGNYTALQLLIPERCPPAKAAVRKAKKKLKAAKGLGRGIAEAKRKLKKRKAAAARRCNPDSF